MTIFVRDECMAATHKTTQWRRQNFVPRGHRFGFVKRPKIINVYRTTRAAPYTPEYALLHLLGMCVIRMQ